MHRLTRLALTVTAAVALAAGGAGVATGLQTAAPVSPNDPSAPSHASAPAGTIKPAGVIGANGNQETIFVPITPCRIANTSDATANKTIGDGGTRTFYVKGTFGFAPQGGRSGGCGIPTTATAVATTVSALNAVIAAPRTTAYLLGFPTGGAVPTANFMAYRAGTTGTNPVLTLAPGEPSLSVKSLYGTVALAIDVVGYYDTQIHAVLKYDGGIYTGSSRVLASTHLGTGSYRVLLSGNVAGCTPIASINGSAFFASSYMSGNYVYANTYNPSGTLVDLYWTLTVVC